MVFIVTAENRCGYALELTQMHRQRKEVLVDTLGWALPCPTDLELDPYDREDTIYLIERPPDDSRVLASARLLPTLRPHLMADLFAHTVAGPLPRGEHIWEASRFCPAPALGRRMRLAALWEIFAGVLETALLYGIEQVIFTANAALLPLALRCGWEASVLGPTLPDRHDQVTAVRVGVTPRGLLTLRERFGIPAPITRYEFIRRCRAA